MKIVCFSLGRADISLAGVINGVRRLDSRFRGNDGVESGSDGVEMGNEGVESGSDGVEMGNGGATITYFSLMSARVRLKRTIIAPIFPVSSRPLRLRAFASNFQRLMSTCPSGNAVKWLKPWGAPDT